MKYLKINGQHASENIVLPPDTLSQAEAELSSADQETVDIRWVITPESRDIKSGGDPETAPVPLKGLIQSTRENSLVFQTPARPGPYRLFFYVINRRRRAATANCPFLVSG